MDGRRLDGMGVGESPPARAPRLRRMIPEPASTARRTRGPAVVTRALARQLRPKQWIKNFACLAGLIFSGRLFQADAIVAATVGFWSFCFASSAIYIVNDFFDRKRDRLNPRTASRPLASGDLPLGLAFAALVGLLAAAFGGAAWLGTTCAATLATYVAMNLLYSGWLKRVVIVDVLCIALGFVLRVSFGVFALGLAPTSWILLCMFFLALFLGFAKRRGELTSLSGRPETARPVLWKYNLAYLDAILTTSATMGILSYAMFTVGSHRNPTLVVTIVPVVYCMYRYMLQIHVADRGESPDSLLISDHRLWGGILCWLASYVAIYYGDIRIISDANLVMLGQ